jgi:quercetin dioxygenase-like cupin family protein
MNEIISTFEDEAVALKEITDAGYFPMTLDFPAESNEAHWHDFDSLTYILEGELTLTEADSGEQQVCPAGTKIVGSRGVLHREQTDGYRAIIGFSVNPAELSQPINKAPPVSI